MILADKSYQDTVVTRGCWQVTFPDTVIITSHPYFNSNKIRNSFEIILLLHLELWLTFHNSGPLHL